MGAVIERDDHLPSTASQPADVSGTAALMRVIEHAALDPNFDVEKLNRLFDVKERWEKAEAKKAFDAAMAEFKRNPPQIVKDMHVAYKNKTGGTTEYDHESIGLVCAAVIPALATVGISHKWALQQSETSVKVTCVLTHALGHSDETPLYAANDDSGGKNDIQAIGSTVKYLQRYTLLAAVGLAPMDKDDDGRGRAPKVSREAPAENGEPPPSRFISDKQAADLEAMISEVATNKAQFLRFMKVDALERIPAKEMQRAVQTLNDIRKGKADQAERSERGGKRR